MSGGPSYSQGRVYAWGFEFDVSEMMPSPRDTVTIGSRRTRMGDIIPVMMTTFPWARGPLETGPTCLMGGTSSKVSSPTTAGATCLPMAWSRCFVLSAISTLVHGGNALLGSVFRNAQNDGKSTTSMDRFMKSVSLTANKWIEGISGSPTLPVSQSWRSEPRHKILGSDSKQHLALALSPCRAPNQNRQTPSLRQCVNGSMSTPKIYLCWGQR